MITLTAASLLRVMPRAPVADAWLHAFTQANAAFDIDETTRRTAMFFANIAHESSELTQLEENLRYKPDRLLAVFPKRFTDLKEATLYATRGPEAIANRVYGGRFGNGPEASGDGWRYRARGPIGITFLDNYLEMSIALLGDDTLVKKPEYVIDPEFGAAAAARYWQTRGCNELADAADFDGTCDMVNLGKKTVARGDSNGFADRESYFIRATQTFGEQT